MSDNIKKKIDNRYEAHRKHIQMLADGYAESAKKRAKEEPKTPTVDEVLAGMRDVERDIYMSNPQMMMALGYRELQKQQQKREEKRRRRGMNPY